MLKTGTQKSVGESPSDPTHKRLRCLDLSSDKFRHEIFRFRARRNKNYEAYTLYMLNNFCEVVAEIWKLQ